MELLACETFWSEHKLLQHRWTFCGCHANMRVRRLCQKLQNTELESKSNSLMEDYRIVQTSIIFAEPYVLITLITCHPLFSSIVTTPMFHCSLQNITQCVANIHFSLTSSQFLLILCPITVLL